MPVSSPQVYEHVLTSYEVGYIKNRNIVVQKNPNARSIILTRERKLQELLDVQNKKPSLNPSVPSGDGDVSSATPSINLGGSQNVTFQVSTPIQAVPVTRKRGIQLRDCPVMEHPHSHASPSPLQSSKSPTPRVLLSSKFPMLPPPSSPPIPFSHVSPPLRFPPSPLRQASRRNVIRNTTSSYAHVANGVGYSFTPYERHQLNMGNRNCLLSPGEQRLLYQASQQYPFRKLRTNRASSR